MADASALCLIALETTSWSCCDVSVHCAASIVSPRNLMGVVWKRGPDADKFHPEGNDGTVTVEGPAMDDTDPLRLLLRMAAATTGLLGLRGPEGGGGRVRCRRLLGVFSRDFCESIDLEFVIGKSMKRTDAGDALPWDLDGPGED